jgi:hypothetical protein
MAHVLCFVQSTHCENEHIALSHVVLDVQEIQPCHAQLENTACRLRSAKLHSRRCWPRGYVKLPTSCEVDIHTGR